MRVTCRINSSPARWGVTLAMLGLLLIVGIVLGSLSTAPQIAQASPPPQASMVPLPPQPAVEAMFVSPAFEPAPEILHSRRSEILKPVELSADFRTYQGKKYKYVKTLTLRVTAYAPDPRCTHPYNGTTTASGLPVTTNYGRLAAADTGVIPMHSLVSVPGYAGSAAVPVLDRGSAIKGNRLDVLLPTFDKAQSWGVKVLKVKIYQPQ